MFLIWAICRICDIIFMRRTDEVVGHRVLKTQPWSTPSHSVTPSGRWERACAYVPTHDWVLRNCPSARGEWADPCLRSQTLSGTVLPEKLPNWLPLCLTCSNSLAAI